LENANISLSLRMRNLLHLLWQEWKALDQQVEDLSTEIETLAASDPTCQHLLTIPGVGSLVATAIVAAIGNGAAFRKGREFAAWLGPFPQAVLYRRQGQAARHQQARESLSQKDADSWRPLCCDATETGAVASWRVDERPGSQSTEERADRCHR